MIECFEIFALLFSEFGRSFISRIRFCSAPGSDIYNILIIHVCHWIVVIWKRYILCIYLLVKYYRGLKSDCVGRRTWWSNLVPRACDPREGTRGSGIIRCRKPGIMAKIELRIISTANQIPPWTDYPRASRSFPRIAGSGDEIVGGLTANVTHQPRTQGICAVQRLWYGKQRPW
jgi:hypothetical protein